MNIKKPKFLVHVSTAKLKHGTQFPSSMDGLLKVLADNIEVTLYKRVK